jgi:tetratricopeptide (TPR) repeat protein
MQTKLGKFLGGVIEASWLGALIIIPIFFNVYSSRIFEPDKAALLRILVLLGVAAWFLKTIDEFANQDQKINLGLIIKSLRNFLRKPIILVTVILVFIYLLATLLSVNPTTSFLGSYQRSQGFHTLISYTILFFLVAGNLKTKVQVDRIVTVTILTSVPVSLYGIIQHYGLDPVPWAGNVTARISATMGNSIFVAAYLIMIVPITAFRIITSLIYFIQKNDKKYSYFLVSVLYIAIICMQIAAIFYSGSRGPWIGLAVSLVTFWFGLAFIWKKTVLYISGLVVLGTAMIFLVLINIKGGPLEPVRDLPGIGRLGQLFDSESRTGKVRSLIWEGTSNLVTSHEALKYPNGNEDRLNVLRPLIGYGPESLFVAFNRFYPPALTEVEKRNAAPDRSHNEVWDSIVFTGFFGMMVMLLLFGVIIYTCLRKTGFINDRKRKLIFYFCAVGGGLVTTAVLVYWKGFSYFGVGLPTGAVLGVLLFIILSPISGKKSLSLHTIISQRELMILGLCAAILAHSTELIFGFGITATRLYFWVLTGLIFVLGGDNFSYEEESVPGVSSIPGPQGSHDHSQLKVIEKPNRSKERSATGKRRKQLTQTRKNQVGSVGASWIHEGVLSGLLLGLILATLGFDFISSSSDTQTVFSILNNSFSHGGSSGDNNSLAFIFYSCWIIIGLVMILEIVNDVVGSKTLYLSLIIFILSLSVGFIFIFWHAGNLSGIIRNPSSEMIQILKQVKAYEFTIISFVIYSLILLILFGWISVEKWPEKFASLTVKILSPIVFCVIIFAIGSLNIRAIEADIVFKAADSYIRASSWQTAINLFNRSIELAPKEDFYYLFLAKAYFEYAKTLPEESSRVDVLEKAEKDMLKAQAINPLNTDHTANLARLYSTWSELINDPAEQTSKALQASNYYKQAVELSPNNSRILGEWAFTLFSQLDQSDEAYRIIKHALTIDPKYDWLHGLLGEYYFKLAESLPENSQESKEYYLQALDSYQKNFNYSSVGDVVSRYRVMLSIARVLSRLGDLPQSITAYQKAIDLYPATSDIWRIYEVLARLNNQLGEKENSLMNARLALDSAPEKYKKQLESLIDEIENQP